MEAPQNTDNWSSLLSQLGVDVSPENEADVLLHAAVSKPTVLETSKVSPPLETLPLPKEEPRRGDEGKRTFFDRFPKINLFGPPSKDPLDAFAGGAISKPGETFTSKKLEKVEPPPGRAPRRETEGDSSPPSAPAPVSKGRDPWTLIASQVGSLTVPDEEVPVEEAAAVSESQGADCLMEPKFVASRRNRRMPPSMFGDAPAEESEESTAVRNILDAEEPKPFAAAAERLSSILDDRPPRNGRKPEEQRQHVRGRRGGEFREDAKERGRTARETVADDEFSRKREEWAPGERGDDDPKPERRSRGSRCGKAEPVEKEKRGQSVLRSATRERSVQTTGDDDFDVESIWDVEEESKPVERSGRQRSHRPDRSQDGSQTQRSRRGHDRNVDRENVRDAGVTSPCEAEQLHRNIPSWDDAISSIIEANTVRHTKRGTEQRRGKR